MALKKTNKLSSIGYQSVYINSSNVNADGTVRLGIRLSLAVEDKDEDSNEGLWRTGLDSMIDDEETTDDITENKDEEILDDYILKRLKELQKVVGLLKNE